MEKLLIIFMILIFRVVILFLVLINFRINANKVSVSAVYKIFMEIKRISVFLIKIMLAILVFLFLNYNRYIYYRVGITINYGYVLIYALGIVFLF
jgi:archaellum biogenesis protein FlaJ (TadC family)